ncbi:serine/threonine-protein phosphatase 6 regulatory ankyrin repeat subunit B-like isoform X31 [Mytilus californianus]|uniref:serine/threonine-protein phosphatase 6 regulatory ankyrin repeat subunit B-like isoform X31 n=1 Tax=Mytilus californianus TaxID=6549 RepID=UPI0022457DDE|nr:serine/threonine-protein phosphatase 6 regulatory ankyrin repeat subunit B-like isoform X31 [Mytilus californianus]
MPAYMGDDGISPEQRKLHDACLEGNLKDIKDCLGQDGASQYVKDGMMPMHIVACSGREDVEEIIGFLLQSGSDVDAQTKSDEDTILHLIPRHNIIRIAFPTILKILEYKPDVFIRNRHLRSPYDEAIALGYYELANVLDGSRSAQDARKYYEQGIGAMYGAKLVEAVMNSKEDVAKDCIKNGANVNYVNEHGAGAIHYLFTHYKLPPENILPLLFTSKADPNLRDYEGDNCLNLAIKSQRLRESGNMYKIVNQLLEKGALSTVKDLDGHDAFAIATLRDYKDIVKLIRKFRAGHLSTKKNSHTTPDEPPALVVNPVKEPTKRQPTVTTLKEDEDDEDDEEDDILDDPDLDVNKPNELGLYPLHQAILRTDPTTRNRLVSNILNRGADVSARALDSEEHDEGGNTALHMAVARDQLGTVKIILGYKPLYAVPNNEDQTLLQIAEHNENEEMIEVLKDYEKTISPPEKTKTDLKGKEKGKDKNCLIS